MANKQNSQSGLVAKLWASVPTHCTLCGQPNRGDTLHSSEPVAWCSSCRRVYRVPLMKVPDWVTGTLIILLLTLIP